MMYNNGVEILAGTDIPNFAAYSRNKPASWTKLLVEAGMESVGCNQDCNKKWGRCIGIINKVGTIEYGKEANMIILTSNPVTNIGNIDKIEAVINDGIYW